MMPKLAPWWKHVLPASQAMEGYYELGGEKHMEAHRRALLAYLIAEKKAVMDNNDFRAEHVINSLIRDLETE
jgi:hypothetical protein